MDLYTSKECRCAFAVMLAMCREEDLIVLAKVLDGNREALAEAEREGGPSLIHAQRRLGGARLANPDDRAAARWPRPEPRAKDYGASAGRGRQKHPGGI